MIVSMAAALGMYALAAQKRLTGIGGAGGDENYQDAVASLQSLIEEQKALEADSRSLAEKVDALREELAALDGRKVPAKAAAKPAAAPAPPPQPRLGGLFKPQEQVPEAPWQPAFDDGTRQRARGTKEDPDAANVARREAVKGAMKHAWDSYVDKAWGTDELLPRSGRGKQSFGGLGATIIDSLDTLFIMGLDEEYEKAKSWVLNLDFNRNFGASVFETTIRVLGGLMSAYYLSGDRLYVDKAKELADKLSPAFNTPTGVAMSQINLASGHAHTVGWTGGRAILAEFSTLQMEFYAVARETGDMKYRHLAEKGVKRIYTHNQKAGLLPLYLDTNGGVWSGKISFGAMGDSYYEYLLKCWVQSGKSPDMEYSKILFANAMMEADAQLIKTTTEDHRMYIADMDHGQLVHKMDHLACFAAGMWALGYMQEEFHDQERYKEIAAGITETCYQMYHMNPSHLAPENVNFQSGKMTNGVRYNIQRPEAVEAIFYMWRLTKDKKYREWGWESEFGRPAKEGAAEDRRGADACAPHSSQSSSFPGVPGAREGAVGVRGPAGRCRPDRQPPDGRHAAELLHGGDAQVPVPPVLRGRRDQPRRVGLQHGGPPDDDRQEQVRGRGAAVGKNSG